MNIKVLSFLGCIILLLISACGLALSFKSNRNNDKLEYSQQDTSELITESTNKQNNTSEISSESMTQHTREIKTTENAYEELSESTETTKNTGLTEVMTVTDYIYIETEEDETEPTTEICTQIATENEETTNATENSQYILDLSDEEKELLLRIGMCEAGGEDIECIASVMCVVLNRVQNDSFPNTIYDVIYQNGQFTPAQTGRINTVTPSAQCYDALDMVLNGWNESQGALYFESCSGSSWHSRSLEYLFSYGEMNFYR